MFTKPIDEITFKDVESFCKEWSEGVRVEYKRELNVKKHIPKVVSSFANTYGGIFLIGVEADTTTNMPTLPIKGIPKSRNTEESIQQSAEMSINPPVRPEVKIVNIPNGNNIVVVVRVGESSLMVPHAIEDSTKVYVRVGSVTQPYKLELANMELIAHMFKRREDSQIIAKQIIDRIEERVDSLSDTDAPNITVITKPVLPYRPVISTSEIYALDEGYGWHPHRVAGGIYYLHTDSGSSSIYREFNEYGIVYWRAKLIEDETQQAIEYGQFISPIKFLIEDAEKLYRKCEYLGNIEVTAQLRQVFKKKLHDATRTGSGRRGNITYRVQPEPECFDSTVSASKRCLLHDIQDPEKLIDIVEELVLQLLWTFNIPTDNSRKREQIRKRIRSDY